MKKIRSFFPVVTIFLVFLVPSHLSARQNTLTGGLGVSFDYSERNYDAVADDPDTERDESIISSEDEEDQWLIVTPMLHFVSEDVRDYFQIRIAPNIRYDLNESETDWNSDFYVSANRFITRTWELEASNSFVIRDYYRSDDVVASGGAEIAAGEDPLPQFSDPQLSPNIGRTRYWRNVFKVGSNHTYKEDSLIKASFDYTVLREDEDDDAFTGTGVEEYDRYGLNFINEHRFSNVWSSVVDLLFVQGDFEETDPDVADVVIGEIAPDADVDVADSDLSRDLKEFHVLLGVENAAIDHNPLSLLYNYNSTRYDQVLQNDIDIHQAQFIWRHDYSQHLFTRLGAGPSYAKVETLDDEWAGNGIAELNYLMEKGSVSLNFEKRFMVDNFSGDGERGFVDAWWANLLYNYSLTQNLALRAELGYLNEDRSDPAVAVDRLLITGQQIGDLNDDELAELEQYDTERYRAGLGLSYVFWRNMTASVDYFYVRQESERFNDDYDDNRILFTISWSKELFRW